MERHAGPISAVNGALPYAAKGHPRVRFIRALPPYYPVGPLRTLDYFYPPLAYARKRRSRLCIVTVRVYACVETRDNYTRIGEKLSFDFSHGRRIAIR